MGRGHRHDRGGHYDQSGVERGSGSSFYEGAWIPTGPDGDEAGIALDGLQRCGHARMLQKARIRGGPVVALVRRHQPRLHRQFPLLQPPNWRDRGPDRHGDARYQRGGRLHEPPLPHKPKFRRSRGPYTESTPIYRKAELQIM